MYGAAWQSERVHMQDGLGWVLESKQGKAGIHMGASGPALACQRQKKPKRVYRKGGMQSNLAWAFVVKQGGKNIHVQSWSEQSKEDIYVREVVVSKMRAWLHIEEVFK